VDVSKEELLKMAQRCEVKYDQPDWVLDTEPHLLSPGELELNAPDRDAFNAVVRETHAAYRERVRQLYVEVTGDTAGTESLSPRSMGVEVYDKTPKGTLGELKRNVSAERAGLRQAPTDLSGATAAERLFRYEIGLGDEFERRLGERLGPQRSHALRARKGGWANRNSSSGCPTEEGGE
jgi:hypothetical protein